MQRFWKFQGTDCSTKESDAACRMTQQKELPACCFMGPGSPVLAGLSGPIPAPDQSCSAMQPL